MDRVFDSDSKDRGFESRQARLKAPPKSLDFIGMAGELFLISEAFIVKRFSGKSALFRAVLRDVGIKMGIRNLTAYRP